MEGDLENLKILSLEETSGSINNSDISNNKTDIDGINAPAMLPQEILPETAWIEILTCFKNTKADAINLCNASSYLERVLLTRVTKQSKVHLLCGKIFPMLLSKQYLSDRDFNSCLKSKNLKWYNLWKNRTIRLFPPNEHYCITTPYTSADVVAFGEVIEEDEMVQSWHKTEVSFCNREGQQDYWKTVENFLKKFWSKYSQFNIRLMENELPQPYRRAGVQQVQSVDYSIFLNFLTMGRLAFHVGYHGEEMSNSRSLTNYMSRSNRRDFVSYDTSFLHATDDFLQVVSNKINRLTVRSPLDWDRIPEEIHVFNHSFEKLTNFSLSMSPLQLEQFYNLLPDLTNRNDLNVRTLTLPYNQRFHHGTYVGLCNKFGRAQRLRFWSSHMFQHIFPPQEDGEIDEDLKNTSVVRVEFLIKFEDWATQIDHIKQFLPRLVNVNEVSLQPQPQRLNETDLIDFEKGKENEFWDYMPNGKVVEFSGFSLYPLQPKYEVIKYELIGREGGEFKTKMTHNWYNK